MSTNKIYLSQYNRYIENMIKSLRNGDIKNDYLDTKRN